MHGESLKRGHRTYRPGADLRQLVQALYPTAFLRGKHYFRHLPVGFFPPHPVAQRARLYLALRSIASAAVRVGAATLYRDVHARLAQDLDVVRAASFRAYTPARSRTSRRHRPCEVLTGGPSLLELRANSQRGRTNPA